MTTFDILSRPLTLKNGSVIKNRVAKSAMSEALGNTRHQPTVNLETLYRRWALGGTGLLITGNVMIDRRALGEPGNVVVENEENLELLTKWAEAGKVTGASIWMQINHPGKQCPDGLNVETVAPSAIPFEPSLQRFFATPRELTDGEIVDIIARFGRSAEIAKRAGFSGVQIHGAHGYLVSQFLSPRHNQRSDKWGGTPEKRRAFLLAVVAEIRDRVGPRFPIGIKLNSADFQKGGFSEEESLQTLVALEAAGIDLIEISGGTYERPVMTGTMKIRESTKAREAYFLTFAEQARATVKVPLILTGGFRTPQAMADAIHSGAIDMVGLARPLVIEPELPQRLLKGLPPTREVTPKSTGFKYLDKFGFLEISWYTRQIHRVSSNNEPLPDESPLYALFVTVFKMNWRTLWLRRLRA
jgi:2,4-dienoyl-CoA reductase-like NADH-dependent reductase (Old Yellow Enzyme family)